MQRAWSIVAPLYRPSAQGFTALLPAALPQQLVLACKETQKPWAQGARTTSSSRTQRYSWSEPSYVRQP
jgi:hypothetical protein